MLILVALVPVGLFLRGGRRSKNGFRKSNFRNVKEKFLDDSISYYVFMIYNSSLPFSTG
jgi:hypothetical protein